MLEYLVVDAGGIIKASDLNSLRSVAKAYVTTSDVLDEIRDETSRNFLSRLPFDLTVREPSKEMLKRVRDWTTTTGEFGFLSLTDLRVLALTLQLEVQLNQNEFVRLSPAPVDSSPVQQDNGGGGIIQLTNSNSSTVVCRYLTSSDGCRFGADCRFSHNSTTTAPIQPPPLCRYFSTGATCRFGSECHYRHELDTELPQPEQEEEHTEQQLRQLTVQDTEQQEESEQQLQQQQPVGEEHTEQDEEANSLASKSRIFGQYAASSTTGFEEDDGKNWIDSTNAEQFMDSFFGKTVSSEETNVGNNTEQTSRRNVGCITTDYTMQNVLLQMNLQLFTSEGRAINHVRHFVLECTACFDVVHDLSRSFCPRCGNATLARISCSIDKKTGKLKLHYRKNNRAASCQKGLIYSIPKNRGGRELGLLLREDELMMGKWKQKVNSREKNMKSAFGENLASTFNLTFSEKDTKIPFGYGRRNPNAQKGRERRGKKKKKPSK